MLQGRFTVRGCGRGRTVGGFSVVQGLMFLAIVALALSIFLPAFRVQCAAAHRASELESAREAAQKSVVFPAVP